MNEQIRAKEVRLIDAEGEQVGVVSIEDALQQAADVKMDLVEISPDAEPPVCRIMDHGKFVFDKKKKLAQSRKKQRQTKVKEIKFRPTTERGDYQVKLNNILKFLGHGDKVKITVRFRGREMAHQQLGMDLLMRLQEDVTEAAIIEFEPKLEGRQLTMVLGPKK